MPTNADYTREYFQIMDALGGDVAGRRAAYDYMQSSTAIVHHRVVACSFIPRLFNRKTYDTMKETAGTAHRILVKVIERYLADPEYRRAFDFDPRLEELILLPRGYDSVLPFARVDTFLDEDDYRVKFCEFNADGSSGMNENREITTSVAQSETFKEFASRHQVEGCELFESWVQAFLDIYATYARRVENPRIAICDYLENGVVDEFHICRPVPPARRRVRVVADVREFSSGGEALRKPKRTASASTPSGGAGDQRRHRPLTTPGFLNAVRAEKVALIGSFAGHIVHDKQIFKVLFDERTLEFLDGDEISFIEETVPMTAFLDDDYINVPQIRANKDEWIIKPTDHYGADDVYAGCYVSQEEWEGLIDKFANGRAGSPFIVQRYIRPFKTETLPPDTGIDQLTDDEVSDAPKLYNNLNGLYLYDGVFQGVFSRLGPLPTISKDMQGMTAATIWVD